MFLEFLRLQKNIKWEMEFVLFSLILGKIATNYHLCYVSFTYYDTKRASWPKRVGILAVI